MKDGHINKCKDCASIDALSHRNKNIDRIRAYDRDRAKKPERAKASYETSKAWRKSDPRIVAAHNAVSRAIRSGSLLRLPCNRCGNIKSIAHHESYDNKLDVVWLCQPCHKIRHKEMAIANIEP